MTDIKIRDRKQDGRVLPEVVVKTDLVTEIARTLLMGREVRFLAETDPVGRVDIIVQVVKSETPPRRSRYSQMRLTAPTIIKHGADSCYVEAVKMANFDLSRVLGS